MKNIYFLIFACIIASCNHTVIISDNNTLKGSGNVITKTIEVGKINIIELQGTMNIIVNQGNNQEIKFEADDNIIQYMDYEVNSNKIILKTKENEPYSSISPTKFNVYLTLEQLIEIENHGSGDITLKNIIIQDLLKIQNHGSGDINVDSLTINKIELNNYGSGDIIGNNLIGDNIEINNSGSGDIKFQGKINIVNLNNNGSGDVNTSNLIVNIYNIENHGSGDVKVFAEKEISIHNSGSGDINYKGNAIVKSLDVSGSGVVIKD